MEQTIKTISNQPQSGFVPVFGESMAPELNPGDMVAVEQISNLNILLWGGNLFDSNRAGCKRHEDV